MKKLIEYKDFKENGHIKAIKDIDTKKMTVTGYFGAFNNEDLGGDIIKDYAVNRTISQRGPEGSNDIFFLHQHNTHEVLGKPNVLKADSYGIYHESPISNTTLGKDTAILIEDGILDKFSIGYQVLDSEWDGDVRYLKEIRLYEGSIVTFPMNENANLTGIKSVQEEDIEAEMKALENYIRKTTVSDETIKLLLLKVRQLNQMLLDNKSTGSEGKSTHSDSELTSTILNFTKNLNDGN